MAYLSLYRKWRPQTFEDVVGQQTSFAHWSTHSTIVARPRIFLRPAGTGKDHRGASSGQGPQLRTRSHGPGLQRCTTNCRRVAEGNALDVIEIDGASNRGIDEVREIASGSTTRRRRAGTRCTSSMRSTC